MDALGSCNGPCCAFSRRAARLAKAESVKKILLWRDVAVGVAAIIGLPLLVYHNLHDKTFLIFTCLFVSVIFVPRTLHSLMLLIDETVTGHPPAAGHKNGN